MKNTLKVFSRDGVCLAYDSQGQGEPLVLLSGQGQDRAMWDFPLPFLTAYFRVIRLDYRGTGLSDKPRDKTYSTSQFAEDVIELLDALRIKRAHIYGISLGGRVAQWLGIDFPERIGALVLGATTPGKQGVGREAQVNRWLQLGDIQHIARLQYSAEFAAAHPELLVPASTPPFARQLHYQASEQHDTLHLLKRIQAPTLILHGSDDRINPTANAWLMAEHITHAQVHIIQGARHGYMHEFAQESCAVVIQFLQQHRL